MTYKHVKFEDSVTMRSLEKVAKEKGLLPTEAIKKTASNKKEIDLSVTINLMENILKLSSGLREIGFDKYANELETNYFNYKQAQTFYETSSEKGEDLVDAAHPKGSHKLENVDSDEAVIETILDQHLKNLKMIEKKPTGKLSNALNIIKAVKIVLSQDESVEITDNDRKLYAVNLIKQIPNVIKEAYKNIATIDAPALKSLFEKNQKQVEETVNNISVNNIGDNTIASIKADLNDLASALNFVSKKDLLMFTGPIGMYASLSHIGDLIDAGVASIKSGDFTTYKSQRDNARGKVNWANEKMADVAQQYLSGTWDDYIKSDKQKQKEAADKAAFEGARDKEIANLNDWISKVDVKKFPKAIAWMKGQIEELGKTTTLNDVNKLKQENSQGYNVYIKPYLAV